jgi:hypothetical protein
MSAREKGRVTIKRKVESMSTLGWVDFSSTDREQVSKILAMLREKGTLDELGIGQIRDAYADLLFPGFSTIQTRAKYLITVPRILRDYHHLTKAEKKRIRLEAYLKERENEVARRLVEKHGNEEEGIIGSTRINDGGVSRRPSSVYWNAFRQFGIIKTEASLSEFCREYEKENSQKYYVAEHDDGMDDAIHNTVQVKIPSYDPLWMDKLSMKLTHEEADFLYQYIMQSYLIADSIPSQLFKYDLVDTALEEEYNSLEALTVFLANESKVSSVCRDTLKLANEFSLAMEGPHIRYNIILARKNGFADSVEKYTKEFEEWKAEVLGRNLFYAHADDAWLSGAKRELSRVFKARTTSFVKLWSDLMRSGASDEMMDALVEKQAIDNKKERSLLRKKVVNEGWVGIRRLDYRWFYVRKILKDIQQGLKNA